MRILAGVFGALVVTAGAHAGTSFVALPSPIAPLSASPPLSGGATATSERIQHRVAAHTRVEISLDRGGSPFAVIATQRLEVAVLGDYFFTVGAPVLDVEAAPGSESTPGLRSSSIVWAGFDPGTRRLAARATLDPATTASSLPLRVEVANGRTVLVNATGITVGSYTADATRAPLVAYLQRLGSDLAAGRIPVTGNAYAASKPHSTQVSVEAPLLVEGTIGNRAIHAIVRGRLVVPAVGAVRLIVRPANRIELGDLSHLSGRQLFALAMTRTFEAARARQYETFLGNPDPGGSSETTYVYRTTPRPAPPVAAATSHHGRSLLTTLATVAVLVVAAFLALVAWARS